MNRFHRMLRSRTFWVFILVFVVNGLEGVRDSIPPEYLPFINALLMGAGIYFRIYPAQQFGVSQGKPPVPSPLYPAQPPQPSFPGGPPSFLVQPPFFNPAAPFPAQPFQWSQPQPLLPPAAPLSFAPPSFESSVPAMPSPGPIISAISPESDRDEKGGV